MKDIAQVCGVSVATVSRALNGLANENKPINVMICKTAREMGYVPNAAALSLKTSRSNNIGILYENRMDHEYFSGLINALRREADENGYDLTLIGTHGGEEGNYYEHARRRNLDGVIVIQADFESAEVIRLATSTMPSVIIDHMYEGCNCVGSDNRASMAQLVRYAWSRGHRLIAYITGEDGAVTRERLAGFYKTCAELGLRVPESFVKEGHFHEPEECAATIRALLEAEEAPTCILCPDDYSCLGAIRELNKAGIGVPDAVSLIGYDGIGMGQMFYPRLTTYRQDTDRVAREAVNLLLETIAEEEHMSRQVIVEGAPVEGETVGEPSR